MKALYADVLMPPGPCVKDEMCSCSLYSVPGRLMP